MLININDPIMDGETHFRRITHEKDRLKVHQGGLSHLERMYASGGFIVSIFHNYLTNKEEPKYITIETALERYEHMREMREKAPEWVDDGMMPAILKAIRAAQRQISRGQGLVQSMGDPSEDDIEKECGFLNSFIAEQRNSDPELDKEMTKLEKEVGKA